jgi:hypothetical protein
MCPQGGLSPEYSCKGGLQTIITEKLLQSGARYNGPNPTWASRWSEDVGRGDIAVGLRLVV